MRDHDEVFRRVMEAKAQYERQQNIKNTSSVFTRGDAVKQGKEKKSRKRSASALAVWGRVALCAAAVLAVVAVTVAAIKLRLSEKKPARETGVAAATPTGTTTETPTGTVTPTETTDPFGKAVEEGPKATDQEIMDLYFPAEYTGYRYPSLPGMTTWAYGNHADMVKACRIPDEVLSGMSTENLVQTVLFYPLFLDVLAYDSMDMGYNAIKQSFNGLSELCKRTDRNEALLAVVRDHKNWFFDNEPITVEGIAVMPEEAQIPYKSIHQTNLFLIRSEDFSDVREEVASELRISLDDFISEKVPYLNSSEDNWGEEPAGIYDKAFQDADENTKERLRNLTADGVYGVTNPNQCTKQIQILRGIIAPDTRNITLAEAEAICAGTEKEFIGNGARGLAEYFDKIAGAPDVWKGSADDCIRVYYTNETKTEYVEIHWIYAMNPETSVTFHAADGQAREIRLWK